MEMDLKAAMKKIIDNTTICYRQWHLNSGLSIVLDGLHYVILDWHESMKRRDTNGGYMWYRSPELLFGESVYGPEIDMWRWVMYFVLK